MNLVITSRKYTNLFVQIPGYVLSSYLFMPRFIRLQENGALIVLLDV